MFDKIYYLFSMVFVIVGVCYLLEVFISRSLIRKGHISAITDCKIRIVLTSIILVDYIAIIVMSLIVGTANIFQIFTVIIWVLAVCFNIVLLAKKKKELKEREILMAELEGFKELSPEELLNTNG